MRRLGLVMTVLLSGMAASGGCQPQASSTFDEPGSISADSSSSGVATHPSSRRPGRADWPFWPTGVRVHPASRIVPDATSGEIMIEARIEFHDQFDDVSKAFGQVRLDLHRTASSSSSEAAGTWNMDLRDVIVNRDRYDEVTRTYLFRLALQGVTLPDAPVLKVYYLGADGATLRAEAELRRQRP